MRALIAAMCAATLFVGTAFAQNKDPETQPITSCAEVAKPWVSPYFVTVRLLLRADCTFEVRAMLQTNTGTATIRAQDGALIIPLKRFGGDANERLELRRSWFNLYGDAVSDITSHKIAFHPAGAELKTTR